MYSEKRFPRFACISKGDIQNNYAIVVGFPDSVH